MAGAVSVVVVTGAVSVADLLIAMVARASRRDGRRVGRALNGGTSVCHLVGSAHRAGGCARDNARRRWRGGERRTEHPFEHVISPKRSGVVPFEAPSSTAAADDDLHRRVLRRRSIVFRSRERRVLATRDGHVGRCDGHVGRCDGHVGRCDGHVSRLHRSRRWLRRRRRGCRRRRCRRVPRGGLRPPQRRRGRLSPLVRGLACCSGEHGR